MARFYTLHSLFPAQTTIFSLAGLFLVSALASPQAMAQRVQWNQGYSSEQSGNIASQAPAGATGDSQHGGEHFHAKGHRPPPIGYQEAPSVDIQNGPDPDHLKRVKRDNTTGTDLSKFGTAYQNSSPVQSGSLGDATGNGWTQQRGNGW